MTDIKLLCDRVRQTSYGIHQYHGHGHLEKVYENALTHRLQKAGLDAKQQQPIAVYDEDGTLLGNYRCVGGKDLNRGGQSGESPG